MITKKWLVNMSPPIEQLKLDNGGHKTLLIVIRVGLQTPQTINSINNTITTSQ